MKLKIILSISSLFHAFKVQSIEMVFLLFILYRFIIVIVLHMFVDHYLYLMYLTPPGILYQLMLLDNLWLRLGR